MILQLSRAALLLSVFTLIVGCPRGGNDSTSGSPETRASASVSDNNPCKGAEFTPQQFTGDWAEPGEPAITTLGADGTSKLRYGAKVQSGTWSYAPWESTPGKDRMPPGQATRCVLWLRWNDPGPTSDLVYVPLHVTDTSLELSYVGRGNTLTWVRAPSNRD
jgi:hypothetical protein